METDGFLPEFDVSDVKNGKKCVFESFVTVFFQLKAREKIYILYIEWKKKWHIWLRAMKGVFQWTS